MNASAQRLLSKKLDQLWTRVRWTTGPDFQSALLCQPRHPSASSLGSSLKLGRWVGMSEADPSCGDAKGSQPVWLGRRAPVVSVPSLPTKQVEETLKHQNGGAATSRPSGSCCHCSALRANQPPESGISGARVADAALYRRRWDHCRGQLLSPASAARPDHRPPRSGG